MTDHTDGTSHIVGLHGAMRPQLKLVRANGHTHGAHPRPVVIPLPDPYVDIDLVRLERQAARDAARAAASARAVAAEMEREALDRALREDAEEHLRVHGTLRDLKPEARFFLGFYFAVMAALAGVALWHLASRVAWPW